jgi:hypothetical protein
MTTVAYTRKNGKQLTYEIRADERGRFSVHLGEKEMLRGRDGLSANGGRKPNRRKLAGAIDEAQRAIEDLTLMDEL